MTVKLDAASQYHLHFFFNPDELHAVIGIHQRITLNLPYPVRIFPLLLLHPAGPLPKSILMLEFFGEYGQGIIEFFEQYQQQYSILIHPELGTELLAHTRYAIW